MNLFRLLALFGLLALPGCAQWQAPDDNAIPEVGCEAGLTPADKTRLAAIEQQVLEGKVYAALAQLDALALTSPKAKLIRADALRRTTKAPEALPIYESLLSTCHSGQAHHGLGLAMMREGVNEQGLTHLKAARDTLPTSADIRNDYGYALLLMGKLSEAQFEFLTALDLAPGHPRAGRNAVTLLLKKGESDRAGAFGHQLGLDQSTMDKLRSQAAELKLEVSPRESSAP